MMSAAEGGDVGAGSGAAAVVGLGVVLVAATVSYLVDVLAAFLVPEVATQVHPFLTIAPLIAEVWMLGYLLVKGVRSPRIADRGIVAPVAPMPAAATSSRCSAASRCRSPPPPVAGGPDRPRR